MLTTHLLFNGYRDSFPRLKRAGRDADHSSPIQWALGFFPTVKARGAWCWPLISYSMGTGVLSQG